MEAGLDDVHPHIRDAVDALPGLPRRLGDHVGAGDVQPRPVEPLTARLLVAHAHALHAVVAERVDCGDAVVGVEPQLRQQLVVERQRRVAVVEMCVGIDEPRDDGLAGDVHAGCAGGNRHVGRRADRLDTAAGNEHRGRFDGRRARAVDDPRAGQRDGLRLRKRRLRRGPSRRQHPSQPDRRQR